MATIIFENSCNGYLAIRISKGEEFFVNHMIPDDCRTFAKIERMENGSKKLTTKTDLLAIVESLHKSQKGCKHIRFIRNDRSKEGARGLQVVTPKQWPRLRVALGYAGKPATHVQGGFENAVAYSDEIAIPNYSMSGSSGWIVRRDEIGKYLDALPELKDSGKIEIFLVGIFGWMNVPDDCSIDIIKKDATEKLLPYTHLYKVEYDKGSCLVKKITDVYSNKESTSVGYKVSPVARYIHLGRRLPADI